MRICASGAEMTFVADCCFSPVLRPGRRLAQSRIEGNWSGGGARNTDEPLSAASGGGYGVPRKALMWVGQQAVTKYGHPQRVTPPRCVPFEFAHDIRAAVLFPPSVNLKDAKSTATRLLDSP